MKILLVLLASLVLLLGPAGTGKTIRVPGEYPSIQAAVKAAKDGDTVLIAPGLYRENIVIRGKTIALISEKGYGQTVIDGGGGTVLVIEKAGPSARISGLTIQNGDDGISTSSRIQIVNNRFTGNKDAIDYEGGGGICRSNLFENNQDDAVDLDDDCEVVIEDNVIRNNRDDGIEIRLQPYTGPTLEIVIRNNVIADNGEDGIQFIDYNTHSDRVFRIERNVIAGSVKAGVGCMGNQNSRENYEAFPLPEPIFLVNNTFVGNHYGVTGGNSMIVLNNIFAHTREIVLKRVAGGSTAAYNLFWGNGRDFEDSAWDSQTTLQQDPRLNPDYRLNEDSPCVDAGAASFQWDGREILSIPEEFYCGAAPDLGAFELKRRPQ